MPDRCVCCGEIIPEGTMVCRRCMASADEAVNQNPNRKGECGNVGKVKKKRGFFEWLAELLSSEY